MKKKNIKKEKSYKPNKELLKALEEGERILKDKTRKRYDNMDDLIKSLESKD